VHRYFCTINDKKVKIGELGLAGSKLLLFASTFIQTFDEEWKELMS
jgi:hypothetical protein